MIETCPFTSGINASGQPTLVRCVDSCALNIKGKCALAILAESAMANNLCSGTNDRSEED